MQIRLPDEFECDHCVLQWRYHTGNSWGTDENGHSGIGLGYQEEFYGCADIEIISTAESSQSSTIKPTGAISTTSKAPTTSKAATSSSSGFCSDQDNGEYAHDKDCSLFYHCNHGITYEKECPAGLHFNPDDQACDWPSNVNCSL